MQETWLCDSATRCSNDMERPCLLVSKWFSSTSHASVTHLSTHLSHINQPILSATQGYLLHINVAFLISPNKIMVLDMVLENHFL